MPGEPENQLSPSRVTLSNELTHRAWRWLNWLCVAVVLVLLGVRTWQHKQVHFFNLPVKAEMNDFGVNVSNATKLCQDPERRYWRDFVYPPPAVLLFNAFGKQSYPTGFLLWLGWLGASLIGSFLLALRITSTGSTTQALFKPPSGLILALSFAATEYYCLWDLHVVNTNSIYLFLVVSGLWCWLSKRSALAGFLLGASVAVKIYSLFFLPFLLVRRQWKMCAAMCFSLAFFFLALPAACFGFGDAVEISGNWLRTVASAGNADYLLNYSGYKMSLSWSVMLLLDPRASDGQLNLLHWSPLAVVWSIRALYAVWLVLVVAYFARSTPIHLETQRGRLALALDASVLLMFPLPLSPFLQPPHPVVLLLPAVALLRYAFDGSAPSSKRVGAALAVASGVCVELAHFPWRGIGAMLTIAGFFAGVWMVRRTLTECEIPFAPGQRENSMVSRGQICS